MRLLIIALISYSVLTINSQAVFSQSGKPDFPVLSGKYLGQKSPGDIAEVFAPGIISKGFHELSPCFTPDGKEMHYIMSDRGYSHYFIVCTKVVDGVWSAPEISPISGNYSNYSVSYAGGGSTIFFSSKRPTGDPGFEEGKTYIWSVKRLGDGWGDPVWISVLNDPDIDFKCPSVAENGNMYITGQNKPGEGNIYISRFLDGEYKKPERIRFPVGSESNAGRPFIAPDESYMLFQSTRQGGLGSNDIYVSYNLGEGNWNRPLNLGEKINSSSSDFGPFVSSDGKYLFFSSYRPVNVEDFKGKTYDQLIDLYRSPKNGYATIFWIDAGIISELKPDHIK